MTPDQLRTIVRVDNGNLHLALRDLGDRVSRCLSQFFPRGILDLRNSTMELLDGGVMVRGTGIAEPFNEMAVTAALSVVDAEVHARITAIGGDRWSFAHSFPKLAGTVFEKLEFTEPTLYLDSAWVTPDYEPELTPMTFSGRYRTGLPAVIDVIFRGQDDLVEGLIQMAAPESGLPVSFTPAPDVMLVGPEGAELDLSLLKVKDLGYLLQADPELNLYTARYDVSAYAAVSGSVPVTTTKGVKNIYLETQVFDRGDQALFVADLGEVDLLSPSELTKFTGVTLTMPDSGFSVGNYVRLGQLSMLLHPEAGKIGYVALTIEVQDHTGGQTLWKIVPGLIELQAIDILFRVDAPGPDAKVSGSIHGLLAIGETGTLTFGVDLNERTMINGSLRRGDPLNIREVYRHFTEAQDVSHLPDLQVDEFDLAVTFGSPVSYLGAIRLTGDWKLIENKLSLLEIAFALTTEEGKAKFVAAALLMVDKVRLSLSATYGTDEGWLFEGESGQGQMIALGKVAADIASKILGRNAAPPEPIKNLTLQNLKAKIGTKKKLLALSGQATMPLDGVELKTTLEIDTDAEHQRYGGSIALARQDFKAALRLRFMRDSASSLFAAVYEHVSGETPQLKQLIEAVSPKVAAYVPSSVKVDIRQAAFASVKRGDKTASLFLVEVAAVLDLNNLPLAGEHLKSAGRMGVDPLRVLSASGEFSKEEVGKLKEGLESRPDLPDRKLGQGFVIDGELILGPLRRTMELPVDDAPPAGDVPDNAADTATWFSVQKAYGPIRIDRVGLAYRRPAGGEPTLALLLDAAITVGALTLAFDGLRIDVPLSGKGTPQPGLSGLGLSFATGKVAISGAFLRGRTAQGYDAYTGAAVLTIQELTIGAIGSYAELPGKAGEASLFVYAWLDYPLGGPAFFHVEGLAAGFGYNRRIIMPGIDRVAEFPLVAEALGRKIPGGLAAKMTSLEKYLQPSQGDYWLALGVRFSTFKMVDSFVLVTAAFGRRVEFNVLGLSTLTLPARVKGANVTPVAQIQLVLKATFVPDDGVFSLAAQLTPNSYLLDRACRLSGGIAFACWFDKSEHAGDFVLSLGGYHPRFNVPAHYPAVPRLALNWQVSSKLSLKGSAYCALTPAALMAGGSLTAAYRDGSLSASFSMSMDLLMAWQPYHYEASFHVEVSAAYTFSTFFGSYPLEAHVGADVRIEGPEFGGVAHIDIGVISFTITFGSKEKTKQDPLDWQRFEETLLPGRGKVVTVAVRGGSGPADGDGGQCVVNPASLVLVTDSAIPSLDGRRGPAGQDEALPSGAHTSFGVAPLKRPSVDAATHRISISRSGKRAEQDFAFQAVRKKLPAALWDTDHRLSLNRPQLVENLLTGYEITPKPVARPATALSLNDRDLRATGNTVKDTFTWNPPPNEPDDPLKAADRDEKIKATLNADDVVERRRTLLSALTGAGLLADAADPVVRGFGDFRHTPRVAHG